MKAPYLGPSNVMRIETLEQKIWRMEKIIWYIASMITLKAGIDIAPTVLARLYGG